MCPQLKKRKCKCPSASDCRDCRRIRLRKIVVSTWRVVCRRLQTVSGVAFDLHQKAHDQSGKSTGRRSAVCPGGAGPASASGHSGHPQHVWNGNRTVKQPAADVFAARVAPGARTGIMVPPTLKVAAEQEIICPECGERVHAPSAEQLAFNSQGACPKCGGTGSVRTVDLDSLVPDDSISIDEGAVAPWNSLMWSLMTDVCREMGVRTDIPFKDLTDEEKDIVYHGPAEKKHIFYKAKKSNQAGELDFTYYNAVYTVENALAKVKDEKGMKRVEKFLKEEVCPECGGSRLSEAARAPKLCGIGLAEACKMTLKELVEWVAHVPESLPKEMRPMAESICESFKTVAKRLMDLGLSYLSLDRAAATLSTGERQRMQLARAVPEPHDRRVVCAR